MRLSRIVVVFSMGSWPAFAHNASHLTNEGIWRAWNWEPWIWAPLLAIAILYVKGDRGLHRAAPSRRVAFWTGWCVLTLSLISPLHALGGVLFSVHMTQHELLMLAAAPLLAFSRPLVPFLWGLPISWRRAAGHWSKQPAAQKLWRAAVHPMGAWCQHAAVLWIWHAPPLFEATLSSEWVHASQHICFLTSALLFWWSLFYSRQPGGRGAGVLYVFTTAAHTSILGALLTFAPHLWYPAYANSARSFGWDPLEDQQLGGLIMWIPAGLIYTLLGLALLAAWLRDSDGLAAGRTYAE